MVAYAYHPNAQTLFDAHIKPRAPTFVQGRLQIAQSRVPERTLWSYIIQIAGAMKAAHDQGLPVRMIDVTKVIVTGQNRVRISSCGLADVLTYNPSSPRAAGAPIPTEQIQEDLVMFGKLIMALCCNNVAATSNFGKSLDLVTQHYSADLKNVALFCLSKAGAHKVTPSHFRSSGVLTHVICLLKHIGQLFDMIGSRLLTEMDDLQKYVTNARLVPCTHDLYFNWWHRHSGMDHLEGQLMSELENARLVRLLAKFGFINERPECVPMQPSIIVLLKLPKPGSPETHDGARLGTDTSLSFSVIMSFTRSTSAGDLSSAFHMYFHVSTRYV